MKLIVLNLNRNLPQNVSNLFKSSTNFKWPSACTFSTAFTNFYQLPSGCILHEGGLVGQLTSQLVQGPDRSEALGHRVLHFAGRNVIHVHQHATIHVSHLESELRDKPQSCWFGVDLIGCGSSFMMQKCFGPRNQHPTSVNLSTKSLKRTRSVCIRHFSKACFSFSSRPKALTVRKFCKTSRAFSWFEPSLKQFSAFRQ